MSDEANPPAHTKAGSKRSTHKAAKDRKCPYCDQQFTSSSLGRHLDLYIKPNNPKKPDGIHNVDEIWRLRGGITRRQPKGSVRHRTTSVPFENSRESQRVDDEHGSEAESSAAPSPSESQHSRPGTSAAGFPIGPPRRLSTRPESAGGGTDNTAASSRLLNRNVQKANQDMRRQLIDAHDSARAAELALREVVTAFRAAKHEIELGTGPFSFNPLSMSFPALVLQCLEAAPTLFSTTQVNHQSPCWSTRPPGDSQLEALKVYFRAEFAKFKATSATTSASLYDNVKRGSVQSFNRAERAKVIEEAKKKAGATEEELMKHLDAAYDSWRSLVDGQRSELWLLELARCVATKQAEIKELRTKHRSAVQEKANLSSQLDQLRRDKLPQEFAISPPAHIPVNDRNAFEMQGPSAFNNMTDLGTLLDNKHADLDSIISASISRWKTVVSSARESGTGMSAQRSLNSPAGQLRLPPAASFSRPLPPPVTSEDVSTPVSLATTGGAQEKGQKTARDLSCEINRLAAASSTRKAVPSSRKMKPASEITTPSGAPGASRRAQKTRQSGKPDSQENAMEVEVEDKGEDNDEDDDDDDNGNVEDDEDDEDEDEDDDMKSPVQQAREAPATSKAAKGGAATRSTDGDEDEEMSDKDADAEMEDDGDEFAHMHTRTNSIPVSTIPTASGASRFSYSQGPSQQQDTPRTTGNDNPAIMDLDRQMPDINLGMSMSNESMYME